MRSKPRPLKSDATLKFELRVSLVKVKCTVLCSTVKVDSAILNFFSASLGLYLLRFRVSLKEYWCHWERSQWHSEIQNSESWVLSIIQKILSDTQECESAFPAVRQKVRLIKRVRHTSTDCSEEISVFPTSQVYSPNIHRFVSPGRYLFEYKSSPKSWTLVESVNLAPIPDMTTSVSHMSNRTNTWRLVRQI